MDIETLGERLTERVKAGLRVAIGLDEAVPVQSLEELKKRASQNETLASRETRLKWMEKPYFLLWVRGADKKIVLGRYIDPRIHSAFSPAIKVEVKSQFLSGRKLPVEFLISSNSLPKVISLQANHTLKVGPNIIMPNVAIKTDGLPEDKYSVSLSTPSGLILDTLAFPVGAVVDPAKTEADGALGEYGEIIDSGLTLQDVIDLVEEKQK